MRIKELINITTKLTSLVLFAFLIGCGTFEVNYYVDPRLQEHVDFFEKEFNKTVTYSVLIKSIDDFNFVGYCRTLNKKPVEVVIDSTFYEEMQDDYITIQQLVLHELGHCSLNLEHDDSLLFNGEPKSIMHSYLFAYSDFYKENFNYYLDELKNKCNCGL